MYHNSCKIYQVLNGGKVSQFIDALMKRYSPSMHAFTHEHGSEDEDFHIDQTVACHPDHSRDAYHKAEISCYMPKRPILIGFILILQRLTMGQHAQR